MKKNKIPPTLFYYFEQCGQVQKYAPGNIIFMQEDSATHFYLIKKGRVRVFSLSKEGKEMTLDIVEKGRIFGESSCVQDSTRPVSVSAINEVELISCQFESLMPYLSQSQELMMAMFQILCDTCNHLSSLLDHTHFYNRYQKIAIFLLEQTHSTNKDKEIQENCLNYTHEEIALCVGLNRVTVSKILNEFKNNQWVYLGYKQVKIIDRISLEKII